MRLIGFAIYLGVGAMFHALFVGPQFDWSSAWTFGWLLGWPLMLVGLFWGVALAVAISVGLWLAVWEWLKMIAHWRERRRKSALQKR